ncbi:MAG: glycosyltransferase [Verrucomicrobiia bacterium]
MSNRSPEENRSPVVAAYCATFLKPEMLHIYRQIDSLKGYRPVVITRRRENEERFPFRPIIQHPKAWNHEIRRFFRRSILRQPLLLSQGETRRLRDIVESISADVLHIYFGNVAALLLPFLKDAPLPVVTSFHGADVRVDLDLPRHRRVMAAMLERVDLVLVRSESLGRAVCELGCAPEKIRIQRTGIPLDYLHFVHREAPADGAWTLIQACRLIPKKGLQTTLEVFQRFLKVYPKSRLLLAGDGPLLEHLQMEVLRLGIGDRVGFTGFLDQQALREQYHSAHLFIHPSETGDDGNQEGIPNSLLEAMATGLPSVATAHGGIPEAITDGESGFLAKERDVDALSEHLLALAADPHLYRQISVAGCKAVHEKFDLKRQIPLLESRYDEARDLWGQRRSKALSAQGAR